MFSLSAPCPLLAAAVLLLTAACDRAAPPGAAPATRDAPVMSTAGFDLERPAARHVLPSALTELSGLAVLDSAHVVGVQDELGVLFVIGVADGRVRSRHAFGPAGDFEALAEDGDTIRVLRSDARLFAAPRPPAAGRAPAPRRLPLDGCNAEGLALRGGALLVACKEDVTGSDLPGVYAFDIATYRPRGPLRLDWVAAEAALALPGRDRNRLGRRLRSLFHGPADGFRPSALAVDPLTSDLWVLSAVPPAVAVFTPDGSLRAARRLPRSIFPQPEALTFLPGGDLLLGSEGAGGSAPLYRFRRRPSFYE